MSLTQNSADSIERFRLEQRRAKLLELQSKRRRLAELEAAEAERRAAERSAATRAKLEVFLDDPVGFAEALIDWGPHGGLVAYQKQALRTLADRRRLALRGPHGLGKTTTMSVALLWFALTRDAIGRDWKIPTTASAWLQLTHYLWPEVHKWARRLRWDLIGRDPFSERTELMTLSLKLAHGEAFSASPTKPGRLEGAHADELLYLFDEGKSIANDIFDAAEGAFSGAGVDTDTNAYAMVGSTPGEPTGRFYDICRRAEGTEDWEALRVTCEQAQSAGRMSAEWAEARRRQWGEASAVYQNRVEGEFASSDEDGVVPLAWVEAAQLRWRAVFGERGERWEPPGPLEVVGVDCSGSGADRTVLARRYGDVVAPLERPRKRVDVDAAAAGLDQVGVEEMATAGAVVAVLGAHERARAMVDAGGLGSGVIGRIREQVDRRRVEAFVAGAATKRKDQAGELGFKDVRSAAWWALRELLDPDNGSEVALPPDDLLTGDLTAPHWRTVSGGKIKVESKDDIRKRLGRSTDSADAVIQAFWGPERAPARLSGVPGRGRAAAGLPGIRRR